jgi:ferric-dicitrate binding protein FerR (iron transport regulator)
MKTNLDWDLLIKYLEGNCSEKEFRMISGWAEQNEENKKELELARRIWDSPEVPMPKPDVEFALKRVLQRIESAANLSPVKPVELPGSFIDALTNYIFNPALLKLAGAVVFIFVFFFLFNLNKDIRQKELKVANKNISEITLIDGSFIKLDAGSVLRYPGTFENKSREVYLEGEAYFEVKSNPQQPFIIHANEGLITVLGTKFNIRAWESSRTVTVSVTEGKVALSRDEYNEGELEKIIIKNGFKGSISELGILTNPDTADVNSDLRWMNREINFNNVPLREVVNQLVRWYDLRITLPDQTYNENRVTVFVENKPLDEILEVISLVINLDYNISGKEVVFY